MGSQHRVCCAPSLWNCGMWCALCARAGGKRRKRARGKRPARRHLGGVGQVDCCVGALRVPILPAFVGNAADDLFRRYIPRRCRPAAGARGCDTARREPAGRRSLRRSSLRQTLREGRPLFVRRGGSRCGGTPRAGLEVGCSKQGAWGSCRLQVRRAIEWCAIPTAPSGLGGIACTRRGS